MTADVKLSKHGDGPYRQHKTQSALAAALLVATLILFSEAKETADGNTLLAVLLGLAGGVTSILTIRSVVRAAAYLSVSAMIDAFGPGDDDV